MIEFEVKSKTQPIGKRKGQTVYFAQPVSQQHLTNKMVVDRIVRETSLSAGDVSNALISLGAIVRDAFEFEERNNIWNTPYLFNAKEFDEETGLYYYGARYYDPRVSVWISVDPISNYDPSNSENYIDGEHNNGVYNSFNLYPYGYCYQNPIKLRDPNGKQVDAVDFIPFVGSGRDIYRGFRDADFVTLGIGFVGIIADAATLGSGSVVTGGIKAGVKTGIKATVKAEVKTTAKTIVKKAEKHVVMKSAKTAKTNVAANIARKSTKPNQVHHFATNKNSTYTPQMEEIANRFGLKLDQSWNKEAMPHLGRHPNAYHQFVLENMQNAATQANGSKSEFLRLFEQNVKQPVRSNPKMLNKSWWNR